MEPHRSSPQDHAKTKTAFIADSDEASSYKLSALLKSLKFETTIAHSLSGHELYSRSEDLVVTRFFVEGLNSLHCIRNTRLLNRHCVIFVLIDQPDKALMSHAFQAGADRVFTLPLDRTAFLHALKRYVEPWHFEPSPFQRLTLREREVMNLIVDGLTSKEAAIELGISNRTLDVHRSRVMDKLRARNIADLVRIVLGERSGKADPA